MTFSCPVCAPRVPYACSGCPNRPRYKPHSSFTFQLGYWFLKFAIWMWKVRGIDEEDPEKPVVFFPHVEPVGLFRVCKFLVEFCFQLHPLSTLELITWSSLFKTLETGLRDSECNCIYIFMVYEASDKIIFTINIMAAILSPCLNLPCEVTNSQSMWRKPTSLPLQVTLVIYLECFGRVTTES